MFVRFESQDYRSPISVTCTGPEYSAREGGGGVLITVFSHQLVSHRPVWTSLEKQLDTGGLIATGGGPCQNF